MERGSYWGRERFEHVIESGARAPERALRREHGHAHVWVHRPELLSASRCAGDVRNALIDLPAVAAHVDDHTRQKITKLLRDSPELGPQPVHVRCGVRGAAAARRDSHQQRHLPMLSEQAAHD